MTKSLIDTNIIDIFASPVAAYSYNNNDTIKKLIEKTVRQSTESKNDLSDKLKHYGNERDESILDLIEYKDLHDWIILCVENYITDILGYKLQESVVITDSWINVCDKGGNQSTHYHTNSFVSGTYYVNYEDGHSPLTFNDRNQFYSSQPSISLEIDHPTRYNCNRVIKPREGGLLLWQSHLNHGYESNQKDSRISISFNTIPSYINSGKYGFCITKN